ncbi:glycosyltransferase family 2 protein [Candidatus Pacearchaeota archaeon]|nr:glycosyltransferase family 2 protein [Candidatus Pacearchaeota archaeon]
MRNLNIVITRFNESNQLVADCLKSLFNQKNQKIRIIYLEQTKSDFAQFFYKKNSNSNIDFLYKKIDPISLSYARDLGIKLSDSKIIAFTDIDAIPYPNWAEEIVNSFNRNKDIAIVGGKSIAKWPKKEKWYHKSKIVLELYSMVDILNQEGEVEKVVGVNFAINKEILKDEATFNLKLGRRSGDFSGGEETDLCLRAKLRGYKIIYNPHAIVLHQVSEDRMSFWWIIKRMYYGGISRSKRGGRPKTFTKKRNFYDKIILPVLITPYLLGFLKAKIK